MVSYFFIQVGRGAHPHSSLLSTFLDCSDIQNVPAISPGFALLLPTHICAQHTESCLRLTTILIWNVLGIFFSKAVLFQLMLLLEKMHVFAQTIKLHPPTALRVETDLRLREDCGGICWGKTILSQVLEWTRVCRSITGGLFTML